MTSLLRTEAGKTVVVNYDMQLPRPYDNRWMLQGTRGVYSEERDALYLLEGSPSYHQWEPFAPYQAKYRHRWWAKAGGGSHGGADEVMLQRVLSAIAGKQPLPLTVYDSVTMSAIIDLSGRSIVKGGRPVAFPDFTRGKWKSSGRRFALDQS